MILQTSKPARNGTGSDGKSLAASNRINTKTLTAFQAECILTRFRIGADRARLVAEVAWARLLMGSRLRYGPMPERLVADVALNRRETLVFERPNERKIAVGRCSRDPAGQTVPTSADRAFSLPICELGLVWPVFRELYADARTPRSRRLT